MRRAGTADSRLEPNGKKGDGCSGRSQVTVDIEVVESLLRPENLEVSVRYVLKLHQRSRTTLWQAEDDGWRVREETVHGKRVGKTSGMTLSIKELWQKPRRAPT